MFKEVYPKKWKGNSKRRKTDADDKKKTMKRLRTKYLE